MSDRLLAVCLALLLAAPLCLKLHDEIFASSEVASAGVTLQVLSRESVVQGAEGLEDRSTGTVGALAAN